MMDVVHVGFYFVFVLHCMAIYLGCAFWAEFETQGLFLGLMLVESDVHQMRNHQLAAWSGVCVLRKVVGQAHRFSKQTFMHIIGVVDMANESMV